MHGLRVVAGESGAGKTEAARVCLQCAVLAGAPCAPAACAPARAPAAALAAAGTLLEAFGNAATARNHNASRFVSTAPACTLHRSTSPTADNLKSSAVQCTSASTRGAQSVE